MMHEFRHGFDEVQKKALNMEITEQTVENEIDDNINTQNNSQEIENNEPRGETYKNTQRTDINIIE